MPTLKAIQFRLQIVSHSPSRIVERAKRESAWATRERRDAAGREDCRPQRLTLRVSPFFRGVIFTRARVSPALLSLRENEELLVVYCNLSPSLYTPLGRRSFAPLQKSLQNHRSYMLTEAVSGMVFVPALKLSGTVRAQS